MLRIGLICPSEIAFRRFMPALQKHDDIRYVGVAIASKEEWFGNNDTSDEDFQPIKDSEMQKAKNFQNPYRGKIFESYTSMITSDEIDAVYLPLPPELHYKWAAKALNNNKHAFIEKPSTVSYEQTRELVELARAKNLALHENYMFIYHSQIKTIRDVILSHEIGDVRLTRIDFGFPERGIKNDFRYIKALGGGALLDCGGYTLKLANYILGGDAQIISANVGYKEGYDVDIYGAATLKDSNGHIIQVGFGMDNDYRCTIDVWGSKGTLRSKRILTAPVGFETEYEISRNGVVETFKMDADDTFYKSIAFFENCIKDKDVREQEYEQILEQEKLVEQFAQLSGLRD